jgi:maleate isomerase
MVERPADIIKVAPERVFAAFDEIDHDDVDTLLHVGGALGTVAMIEALEARYAKPVVAVNAATYWYALRRHGITDAMPGFGQPLMREAVEQ